MTTFDFGFGPVPAHKHSNGRGWVADTAEVADSAYVDSRARVFGYAEVSGYARVSGNARVFGYAEVSGYARVFGNARVSGDARVFGYAEVSGNARVFGYAEVSGYARVFGNASKTPKVLSGFKHVLTVTDRHIRAGCQFHEAQVWKSRGVAILRADGLSSADAKAQTAIILAIAEAHGCFDS